jgi:RNA polymerase sigma factor (sigma-70 family)
MAKRTAAVVARAVRSVSPELAALNDRELIRRFADDGEQAAFAAVVARHTAMVLGVCKRVLHSPADAEDATQAVFLVLAKKAKGTRWQASAANWLYTTARKVAYNAKVSADRRNKREQSAAVPEATNPADTMSGRELIAALDDELDKLTTRYREPLVLCYLEGLTRDEAAARLNLAVPALNKQLERGRKKLHDALAARGCALGVLLLAAASTSSAGASPPLLHESILATVAAGGSPSKSVAALAQGVVMNGVFTRTRLAVLVLVGLMASGFGAAAIALAADPPKADTGEKVKADGKTDAKTDEQKPKAIRGTVVGPDGKPLGKVAINMTRIAKGDKAEVATVATTADDGSFTVTLDPLPLGGHDYRQIVAAKAGFGPDWVNVRDIGDSQVSLKLAADDVPVKGRVTDLEGKAVPKATVRVRSVAAGGFDKLWAEWAKSPYLALRAVGKELTHPALGGLPESVTADADGKFEITGVGRGRMLALVVEGTGIESAGLRVMTDPAFDAKKVSQPNAGTMPGGSFQPGPNLYPPTFTHAGRPDQPIRGTVTDAATGKPVAGVMVSASSGDPHWGEGDTRTTTDKDGKYVIRGVAKSAKVQLGVYPADGQPYFTFNSTASGKPGLAEITADLKLTRGVLVKGKLVEKGTGKPVGGAVQYTALADNKNYADLMGDRHGEYAKTSGIGRDGRFEMVVLPGAGIITAQGTVFFPVRGSEFTQVRIAKADQARGSTQYGVGECFTAADNHVIVLAGQSGYAIIEPKATDENLEVTIEFDRGKSVSGTVVGADGKPASGVTAYQLEACYSFPQKLKDGQFTAIALEADHPRTVLFVDAAKKLSATATLKGDEKDVTVKLRPWGTLSGRVLDADGKPIAGAKVSASARNDFSHTSLNGVLNDSPTTTDADGKFALPVPSGEMRYSVSVVVKNKFQSTGYDPNAKGHAVKAGETTEVGDVKVKGD